MGYLNKLILVISLVSMPLRLCAKENASEPKISEKFSKIFGPGLMPVEVRLPCNYFFVSLKNENNESISDRDVTKLFEVVIEGQLMSSDLKLVIKSETFKIESSNFVVRYKIFRTFKSLKISVVVKNEDNSKMEHLKGSPVEIDAIPVLGEGCSCPDEEFDLWLNEYGCTATNQAIYRQIDDDLLPFGNVNVGESYKRAKEMFRPGSSSFCHYAISENVIYRECFGQYVDFNIFVDAILLYLTKLVVLPDTEFIINLGDWPLMKKSSDLIPIISWCKTNEHSDILWPTYELTQASLECMGRQVLDMLSVQGQSGKFAWTSKEPKAFFRGRDSRQERLDLVRLGQNRSDLFDVGITNFFFFRDAEKELGKAKRVSFFDYFKFKYQLNLDGTVAAYRLPFLLAGNSVVLKQNSKYIEHFYNQLTPGEHYIPFKSDLSDLTDQLDWIRQNEFIAEELVRNAKKFSNENLLPHNIICYHAVFFKKWATRLGSRDVIITPEMVEVKRENPYPPLPNECPCKSRNRKNEARDEL